MLSFLEVSLSRLSCGLRTDGGGPNLLARAIEALEELAEFAAGGAGRDRGRLAPAGVQALLGMEEPTATGSDRDWEGTPRSDSADERRQSPVGCTKNPRRAVEAGPDGLASDGVEVYARRKAPSHVWRAFLKNHAKDLIALDFFTVPTATFRILFVFVVLSHGGRRLVHVNVTEHPTADWTARQLIEACGLEEPPGHLIRDRDRA